MRTGLDEIGNLRKADALTYRRKMIFLLVGVIVVFFFSLCIQASGMSFNSPKEVIISLKMWGELHWAMMTDSSIYLQKDNLIATMPYFVSVVGRLKITIITFGCGMLLALSGALFQAVFRNPIAAPTMLGVSTGVQIGILVLVLQYMGMAYNMPATKYIYCYIGAIAMLAIVLIVGKLSSGKNKFSVFDLLIVGAILSQVAGAVITYYTYGMDNDVMLIYQEISGAVKLDYSNQSFAFLGVALLISIPPIYFIRFSFNAVCFDHDETRSLGINSNGMKFITLVLGTIMVTAAMVNCGTVGMISLIAPFISRGVFGADFRKVFWGNLFIGGLLLVFCRDLVGLIPFGDNGLPIGSVVSFIGAPMFVLILVSQRRVWE